MAINYEKAGWNKFSYYGPTVMNHMDDGIKAACDGVDELDNEMVKVKKDVDALNEGTNVSGKSFIDYRYNEETGFVNVGPSVAFMNVVQMLEHLEDSVVVLVAGHNAANNKLEIFAEHLSITGNPHGTTKADLGMENVENTKDSEKSVKYAASAGSATKASKDAKGNTINSYYAPLSSLQDINTVVNALQTALADAGDNISANANSISGLNNQVIKNKNNVTSLKANMIDGRLSFKWSGTALQAYVDNTFVGNVSLSK